MRLSRFALAGLVVIFGLAAFILFRDSGGGNGADAAAQDPASGTAAGAPLPGSPGSSSADAEALARADAAVTASADAAAAAATITGPRLIVKVMDLVQGAPVANATVWVFDPAQYDEEAFAAAREVEPDWEVHAPRFARKLSTDANGVAIVAQPKEWVRLLGRSGGLYGEHYQETGADGQVVKLLLEADGALRVRVADASGQSLAGVPVGLRTRRDNQSEWLAERLSGADGRAVFAHVQRLTFRRSGSTSVELAPALPLKDPPLIPVKLSALPAEEQLLVLPATGSVAVRLLDPDRRPMSGKARVYLQEVLKERPEWMDENQFAPWALQGARAVEAVDGVARFHHVGLGLGLEVGVDFDGTGNYEMTLGRGPERAGEEAQIEAVQQVLRPSLVLRVLLPDGRPLPNADLDLMLRTTNAEWSNAQHQSGKSDGEGWLRSTLDGDWVQERTDAQRSLEVHYEEPGTELRLVGRLPGRAAWRAGPNELGDLKLEPLAVIAAGHVVDEAGQPIVGASVVMSRRLMRRGRESWRDDNGLMTRSGPDGAFSLMGYLPEGTFRLSARHSDYKPEVLPWREKATDHSIVMKRGRFLQGRVLLDPELTANNLEMRVVPAGSPVGEVGAEGQSRLDRYGQFSCGPGVSERVDLWVFDRQTEQVLYRVEALAGHEPGADPDPRLDPLDLRRVLYEVEVLVSSQAQDELENGINFALSRDAVLPEDWSGTDQRSFKVLVADEGWKLWVQAEGHRREMVDLTGRKVEVSLRSGPRVLIKLADPGVRALSAQMWISIQKDGPGEDNDARWHDLSAEGAPVSLDAAGYYKMMLYFQQPGGENDWNWVLYPPDGFPVEIRDLSGVQEILLPWTEAEVRAAIPVPQGN